MKAPTSLLVVFAVLVLAVNAEAAPKRPEEVKAEPPKENPKLIPIFEGWREIVLGNGQLVLVCTVDKSVDGYCPKYKVKGT